MDEYLRCYPQHTLLKSPDSDEVIRGLAESVGRLRDQQPLGPLKVEELEWPNIAREVLGAVETIYAPTATSAVTV